jgi:DNA-binding transcriptional MerR regulator
MAPDGELDKAAVERWLRERWVTRAEGSRLLGVSPESLRYYTLKGRIETLDAPGRALYSREDVERVARERLARKGGPDA